MFEITFNKVTLPKSNRYLILVSTSQQTKRTQISSDWTSNPEFSPLELGPQVDNLELKLCEATSDRKLKIVGIASVSKAILKDVDPLFEGELKFEQTIEGNRICVGICFIKIARKQEFEEVQFFVPKPQPKNEELKGSEVNINTNSNIGADMEDDELLQNNEEDEDLNQQIRFQFHCGFNFYLGAAFSMEVEWGKSLFKTQSIKDKINPVWSQNCCLSGSSTKDINIKVCDDKKNVLEKLKIGVEALRVMFPYHIRMRFKEEFLGAVPEVYFTIVRQSFPMFSIMEIPIRFSIKNITETKKQHFLMLSLNKEPKLPKFIEVDMGKINSFEKVNSHITGKGEGEEDRIDMVGLPAKGTIKNISIFKSYLNRKLYLHVFWVPDLKNTYEQSNWNYCKIIEAKSDFEVILRKIYYHGDIFTLKNYFEIYNPTHQLEEPSEGQSIIQQWKVLSNNYVLRNKLVNTSTSHIEQLKKTIEKKGAELIELKKVLKEVKIINLSLLSKQKLINIIKGRKNRLNAKQITLAELTTALISKQAELQNQKRINSELALRMDSLTEVEQNQGDLDHQLVRNSEELLIQQQKVKKMNFMSKGIARQRDIIGQLEKVFEKREVDKKINEALKQQSQKLKKIREKKQEGLNNIYSLMKNHNKEGQSLMSQIKRAESSLVSLNEQYARLVGL